MQIHRPLTTRPDMERVVQIHGERRCRIMDASTAPGGRRAESRFWGVSFFAVHRAFVCWVWGPGIAGRCVELSEGVRGLDV